MLPDVEVQAVRQDILAALAPAGLASDQAAMLRDLLDGLLTPRWALELTLPVWLCTSFTVAPAQAHHLVVSNVLGLAYVRLCDDLADNDIATHKRAGARRLSGVLYAAAIERLQQCFETDSRFWASLDGIMADWQAATGAAGAPAAAAQLPPAKAPNLRLLAARGAPLKICCVAACLLADRQAALPPLLRAIDHLLAAAVLLDHFDDAQDDLAAGRYNALIAWLSPLPQTPENRAENRRRFLAEQYGGRQGERYFALMQRQVASAQAQARAVGCADLVGYLDRFTTAIAETHKNWRQAAKNKLRAAAELVFGQDGNAVATPHRGFPASEAHPSGGGGR